MTPATRHMMGAAQFRLMRPTAYLINTCRGPVVDEPALYEALTSGTCVKDSAHSASQCMRLSSTLSSSLVRRCISWAMRSTRAWS